MNKQNANRTFESFLLSKKGCAFPVPLNLLNFLLLPLHPIVFYKTISSKGNRVVKIQ